MSRGRCLTPCVRSEGKYLDCVARHSLVSSSKARKDIYETGLGRSTISKDGCNSVIMYKTVVRVAA